MQQRWSAAAVAVAAAAAAVVMYSFDRHAIIDRVRWNEKRVLQVVCCRVVVVIVVVIVVVTVGGNNSPVIETVYAKIVVAER